MALKPNGKLRFQSFRPLAAVVDNGTSPPNVKVPVEIVVPWSPPSERELTTDEEGKVTGTGKPGPIERKISSAAKATFTEGIELSVSAEKSSSAYSLRGFRLANTDHLVGTVVAISNDLARQPAGPSGPFIMLPVRS